MTNAIIHNHIWLNPVQCMKWNNLGSWYFLICPKCIIGGKFILNNLVNNCGAVYYTVHRHCNAPVTKAPSVFNTQANDGHSPLLQAPMSASSPIPAAHQKARQARYLYRLRPHLQCHHSPRWDGCPCSGNLRSWLTGKTCGHLVGTSPPQSCPAKQPQSE